MYSTPWIVELVRGDETIESHRLPGIVRWEVRLIWMVSVIVGIRISTTERSHVRVRSMVVASMIPFVPASIRRRVSLPLVSATNRVAWTAIPTSVIWHRSSAPR